MRAAKHLQAIGHHLAHHEAHERQSSRTQDPGKWQAHKGVAEQHLSAALSHGHRAGVGIGDMMEIQGVHRQSRDEDLPNVEHSKFSPHEHDGLAHEGSTASGHDPNYRFEIGKHHPMNGAPADKTSLPAGVKIGTRSQHQEGLEHHAKQSALLSHKSVQTVNHPKSVELSEAAHDHQTRAHAHGAHLGMDHTAVTHLIRTKRQGPFQDRDVANADRFTAHPHDDKLNIDAHKSAMEHHAQHFAHHEVQNWNSKHDRTATKHWGANTAHAQMIGEHQSVRHAYPHAPGSIKVQDHSFAPHEADALVHPAHHFDNAQKVNSAPNALAHHIRYAVGHGEQASNKSLSPEDRVAHRNSAQQHQKMAQAHGKDLGLKSKEVNDRIGYTKLRGRGATMVPGDTHFRDHSQDYAVRQKGGSSDHSEPQHNDAMHYHIQQMLGHHDRSLHPDTESDPLTRAHHVGQAAAHKGMAHRHGVGEGLSFKEVNNHIDRAAQEPHQASVVRDSYAVPHRHDRHANHPDLFDRGQSKRLLGDMELPHSRVISSGAKRHHEIKVDNGAFSEGTMIADHPTYGKVRLKPAADIFHEGDKPDAPRAQNSVHREAMVHDLFHNHLGLGEHQHHVGMVHHKGSLFSVHEQLHNHSTLREYDNKKTHEDAPSTYDMLTEHHKSGASHKMAIGDYIVGNQDRHSGNVMVHNSGGSGKPLQLIDHGHALPPRNEVDGHFPAYAREHKHIPQTEHHERLKSWVNGLDENKIHAHIKSRGFSDKVADGVHYRIRNAKAIMGGTNDSSTATKRMWGDEQHVKENETK